MCRTYTGKPWVQDVALETSGKGILDRVDGTGEFRSKVLYIVCDCSLAHGTVRGPGQAWMAVDRRDVKKALTKGYGDQHAVFQIPG
ncbi:hypothetical protein AWU65_07465 [Paenibacillus glucanolyticus]|uniref:Uncharacterized protein n=1 Tax=Paenibacillus glucanolyticus TaxID=59843 RepID=A0A163I2D1_9BACL|nr:hypothetical protein [Paenibacillus glucanolyticus]KZS45761.1 hypothetical protein AWU65_07465 [Paenibacillus glucanolyticus]